MGYDHYHFNQTMTDAMLNNLEKDPEVISISSGTTRYHYYTTYPGEWPVWHIPGIWSPGYYSYQTTSHAASEDDPKNSSYEDGDNNDHYYNFDAITGVNFLNHDSHWSSVELYIGDKTAATGITFGYGDVTAGMSATLSNLTFTNGGIVQLGVVYDDEEEVIVSSTGIGNVVSSATVYYATTDATLNNLSATKDFDRVVALNGGRSYINGVTVDRNMYGLYVAPSGGSFGGVNSTLTGSGTTVTNVKVSGRLTYVTVGNEAVLNSLTVGMKRSWTSADRSAFGYYDSNWASWTYSSATYMEIESGGTASNIYLGNGGSVTVSGPSDTVSSAWNESKGEWEYTTHYASGSGGVLTNLQMATSGGLQFAGISDPSATWQNWQTVYLNSRDYQSRFRATAPQSAYVEFQSNTSGRNINIGNGGSMRISSGASVVGITMGALVTSTFHTDSNGSQMTWVGDRGAKLVINGGFASDVIVEGANLTPDYYDASWDHFSTLSSSIRERMQNDYYQSHGEYPSGSAWDAQISALAKNQYKAYQSSRYNSDYQNNYSRYVGGEIIVGGGTLLNASGFAYLYANENPELTFSGGSVHMSARIGETVSKASGALSARVEVGGAAHLTSVTVAGGYVFMGGESGGVTRWTGQSNAQSNYALVEHLDLRTQGLLGSNNSAVVIFGGTTWGNQHAEPVMSNGSHVYDSNGYGQWTYYNYDCMDPGEIHYLSANKGLVVSGTYGKFTYTGSGAVTINGLGTVWNEQVGSRCYESSYYYSSTTSGTSRLITNISRWLTPASTHYEFGVVKGAYDEETGHLQHATILNGDTFDWKGTLAVGSGAVVTNIGSKAGLKTGNTLTSDSWNPVVEEDASKKLVVLAGGSADNVTVNGKVTNYEIASTALFQKIAALVVSSGGTATNVSILSSGIAMAVGGTIDGVFVGNGGILYLSGWGGAIQVSDDNGSTIAGPQYLDSGVLNNVHLDSGGQLAAVYDYQFGGKAPSIIANKGAGVLNGVTANGVAYVSGLDFAGALSLAGGQQAVDVTVRGFKQITSRDSKGNPTAWTTHIAYMNVSSGGIVNGATVGEEGAIYVSNGAEASNLIASGGRLIFGNSSGWSDYFTGSAAAAGITIMDGGILEVNSKFALTTMDMELRESAGLELAIVKNADEDYAKTELNGTWTASWGNGTFRTQDGVLTGFGGQFGYRYTDPLTSNSYTSARLSMSFLNGGELSGGNLKGYGSIRAYNGGKILDTRIQGITANIGASGYASGLSAITESNGSAYDTNIYVYGDGAVADAIVLHGGFLGVESGGVVNSVTMLAPRGYNGPAGNQTDVGPAELEITAGARANNVVASAGLITLYGGSYKTPGTSAATLSNADIHSAAALLINEDGVVLDGTLNLGGTVTTTATRYEWVEVEVTDPVTGDVYQDEQRIQKDNAVANASTLTVNFDLTKRKGNETTAMIDNLANLEGVTLNAITVSEGQANGTYLLADGAGDFTSSFTVNCGDDEVGELEIGGTLVGESGTYSLAKSGEKLRFTVTGSTGIDPVAAADNWGDLKGKGPEGKVGRFGRIQEKPEVEGEIGKSDPIDYMEFDLDNPAKLSFAVTTGAAAKFTLYKLNSTMGANDAVTYSLQTLQTLSLSAGTSVTPGKLLEAGTYYLSLAAVNRTRDFTYYVSVDPSTAYYLRGDNSDDWTDLKQNGAEGEVDTDTIGTINGASGLLVADDGTGTEGWVGFSDAKDYLAFTLDDAASLSLDLTATDAAKFTVYSLVSTTKNDVTTYSLKSLQATALAAPKGGDPTAATTKNLILNAGTYYIGVESTNAASGGSAGYTIALNQQKSVFFTRVDNSDDWTDLKQNGAAGEVDTDTIGTINAASGVLVENDNTEGWVGYGDAKDYLAFTTETAAKLSFSVSSTDAVKFTVYSLVSTTKNDVTTYSLKALQTVTPAKQKNPEDAYVYSADTAALLLTMPGTYYIGVESTNAASGGNAGYTIAVNQGNSAFFTRGDNSDDWTDLKQNGAEGEVDTDTIGTITAASGLLVDNDGAQGWVGYGDAKDYLAFTTETAAKLSFSVKATDAVKFTVYSLVSTTKAGVTTYSLKALQTVTPAKQKNPEDAYVYAADTATLLLTTPGTYYIGVESTNAASGGNAGYTISVNQEKSAFFTRGDNSDDWTDLKQNGAAGEVDTDTIGTINAASGVLVEDDGIGTEGWVGNKDAKDYLAFTTETAAKLSFSVKATDAVKFTVYSLVSTTKAGVTTYSLKALQTTSIAKQKNPEDAYVYSADTAALLLITPGTYYIGIESTNAASGGDAAYTIAVNQEKSAFFTRGDNSDDWTDLKQNGAAGEVDTDTIGTITAASGVLVEDDGIGTEGWVGNKDAKDYLAFTTESAAKLSFSVKATDAVKFTVYSLVSTTKAGVTTYSLKTLQSVTPAKLKNPEDEYVYSADTATLLLTTPGTYYIGVESTNAAGGGNAGYTIAVNQEKSAFFTRGDNSDDWTDLKQNGPDGEVDIDTIGTITAESGLLVANDGTQGWVGYGDAKDYMAFTLDDAASLSLDLTSTDAAKFTIYSLVSTTKGGVTTYSTKALQATTLAAPKGNGPTAATTKNLLLAAGTYYIGVESTNAKSGGNAGYTIALNSGKTVFYYNDDTEDNRFDAAEVEVLGTVTGGESITATGWVGFTDAQDYKKFSLAEAGKIFFNVLTTDAISVTVYQVQAGGKLKSLQNTNFTVAGGSTAALSLKAGDYYLAITSTNAAKGGFADYQIDGFSYVAPLVKTYAGSQINWTTGAYNAENAATGAIAGTVNADKITFSGNRMIEADSISTGDGNDQITLAKSTSRGMVKVADAIAAGSGNDALTLNANTELVCASLDFGTGNDTFQLAAGAKFSNTADYEKTLAIRFGAGDDKFLIGSGAGVQIYGTEHLLDFGDGNDTMTLAKNSPVNWVNDESLPDAELSGIAFGNGDDALTIDKGGLLNVNVLDFGDGNDSLVLNGTLQITRGSVAGLETVSGSGQLLLAGLGPVDAEDYRIFTDAGIDVVNLFDNAKGFTDRASEGADNELKKAVALVKNGARYERDVWLTGEAVAAQDDFGCADTIDCSKFTMNRNLSVLEMDISGEYSFELLNAKGEQLAAGVDLSGYQELDLSDLGLVNGAAYYVRLTVEEDKQACGTLACC